VYVTATRPSSTRSRVRFGPSGELLALVADAPESPLAFLDTPEGAEPLTRQQIEEYLATLDAEQLDAVVEAARAEAEGIDVATVTSETIERITALGDAVEVAEGRLQQIEQEETARRDAASAALQRLQRPADGPEGDEEGEGDEGAEGDAEGEPEGANAQQPEPVAASGPRTAGRRTTVLPRPGAGGMGSGTSPASRTGQAPAYTAPVATNALVASAGLESIGINNGSTIDSPRQLGDAFGLRIDALRRGHGSGADGEHLTVATVRTTFPEDRRLREGAVDTNTALVAAAVSRENLLAAGQHAAGLGTIVAAGGLCGPIESLNDVPVLGSTARPVRDALANFGAERGGVRWREHLSFGDLAAAVGFWTLADDEAAGDPANNTGGTYTGPTKPCAEVLCPGEVEAYVEAITLCLLFRNASARFDPEGTAANITAAQIAHARIAENRLLAQLGALSTTVTGGEVLGALRDLLVWIDQLLAQYRSFYRLDDAIALRMVLPQWVRNLLRADLTRGMAGDLDAIAVADATIAGWFQTRGVNITWHLDGLGARGAAAGVAPAIPAQAYGAFTAAGAVAAFPTAIECLLWVEGDMLHLDGGTLDLGVVRDSTLNARNEYKTFSESWEGVAHRGVEAIRGVVTTRPLGMVSGTRDTAAILAA
jgi:hypothetical protein